MSRVLVIGCGGVASVAISKCCQVSEVFTELFGGGHAELRLADQDDVLGCDIDIIAQPPGKKLQLLSLLSGGERTAVCHASAQAAGVLRAG